MRYDYCRAKCAAGPWSIFMLPIFTNTMSVQRLCWLEKKERTRSPFPTANTFVSLPQRQTAVEKLANFCCRDHGGCTRRRFIGIG